MAPDSQTDQLSDLDFGKLLGFRNLLPMAKPEDDIRESSEQAFTKKGESEFCTTL